MGPKLTALMQEYAQDHQHPMNRATHKIGVPLVLFHILAMLDWVHLAPTPQVYFESDGVFAFSLGHLFAFVVMLWYLRLSVKLTLWMLLPVAVCFALAPYTSFSVVIGVTIVAWFLQFLGHGVYEKRAPAFFRNLLQILVGPLFFTAVFTGDWPMESEEDTSNAVNG